MSKEQDTSGVDSAKQAEFKASSELVKAGWWGRNVIDLDVANIKAYKEHATEIAETVQVKLVPFNSPLLHSRPGEFFEGDLRFYLRFYLPLKGKPYDKLVVLINGLGEAGPGIHDDIGLELARQGVPSFLFPMPMHFHRHPDFRCDEHDLFRAASPGDTIASAQTIISEVAATPTRMADMYCQAAYDLAELEKVLFESLSGTPPALKGPDLNPFLRALLSMKEEWSPRTTLHLLGYSLGGFVALGMKMIGLGIHSCFLVESGANLEQIDAGMLFQRDTRVVRTLWQYGILPCLNNGAKLKDLRHLLVLDEDDPFHAEVFNVVESWIESGTAPQDINLDGAYQAVVATMRGTGQFRERAIPGGPFVRSRWDGDRIWSSFVRKLARSYQSAEMWKVFVNEAREVFEMIVIGDHRLGFKDALQRNSERILIILGGSDEIFRLGAIQSLSPKDTGLAILQIPGLGHWLRVGDRKVWNVWKGFIAGAVREFTKLKTGEKAPDLGG